MKSLLIIILLALPLRLNAQIILDMVCEGGAEEILQACRQKTEFGDSLAVYLYLKEIVSGLHDMAYLEASVDSLVRTPGRATAYLHTGNRYNRVDVSLREVDRQLLRMLNIRPRRYEREAVSPDLFRNLQERILSYYENSGYPFADSRLCGLEISNDTIRGSLVINRNRYYRIDSIHINGNPSVEPRYLYRHIGIRPGDPYSEKRFRSAGQLIRETPFIGEVRAAEMEFRKETADLYLYLDRRQASRFSGFLGIGPGGSGSRTRLAGELNLELENVFRRMESIGLHWQSPGSQVQQADLQAGQPYLFGSSFGFDLHLHMYRQDSTWLKVEAEAGVPFTLPGRGTVRVFGRSLTTSLIAGSGGVPGISVPASGLSGRLFGVSYRHGRVDDRINPYRGWTADISMGAGNKRVTPPADHSPSGEERKSGFGEGNLHLQGFIPVTPSTTLMLSSLSGIKTNIGSNGKDNYFFANELFLLGGLHSIRGFDERSLAASAFSLVRIEYRYLFGGPGNVFLFFDGMAYRQKLPGTDKSDLPFGFGGGLSIGTRAGQFSINYALGRQLGNPLSLRSGRVHIGIINRF